MRILLVQVDGKIPNIALMRIAQHHRELGDEVELKHCPTVGSVEKDFWDEWDIVYASLIFSRSRPVASRLKEIYPVARVGGSGWDFSTKIEDFGITTRRQDYSIYPRWKPSIGFTQRGCRMSCEFCGVPKAEGKVSEWQAIGDIWRGEPWPRELLLLDNDFFGNPRWRDLVAEINAGGFKVCFNQGINARFLNDESAAALASMRVRDDQFKTRRIYTAWDNRKDEATLFRGLTALKRHGVNPDSILVYMLCGYWPGETQEDREYRRRRLREFGCRPYPMPFVRTKEIVGFQRWVIGAYDKRVGWEDWKRAGYEPRNLG